MPIGITTVEEYEDAMKRIAEPAGCIENSPEEAELKQIVAAVEVGFRPRRRDQLEGLIPWLGRRALVTAVGNPPRREE